MPIVAVVVILVVTAALLATYLTNPFNRFTIVRLPFKVKRLNPLSVTNYMHRLKVRQGIVWRWFAVMKCGFHILHTRYVHSPRSRAETVEGVIADIRKLRFQPSKLLLISGDHFNGLFVRNLGVFYYPTLDTQIRDSEEEWFNRQAVYLQSLAYALGVFSKHPTPTTTIVETGAYSATCINYYAYPSDTVYGLLYALSALEGNERAAPGKYAAEHHTLATKTIAKDLAREYRSTLLKLYEHYQKTVYDTTTGLITTELHLSGAKDITRRRSSFYDNVIFWKTTQLAMRLKLIPGRAAFLRQLKTRILDTFWLDEKGYFLEDLSTESKSDSYYSSDWLIILATNFLDITDEKERTYFERSVEYIRTNKVDEPFPLRYQLQTHAHRQFFMVRIAVASYGGESIWSFWGMEYIKVLLLLHKHTGEQAYLTIAERHIHTYEKLIMENHGFPEVYDTRGKLLQTPLYRSIRQTGWVIGFEQVRVMRDALR